jgi:hypothetical protein
MSHTVKIQAQFKTEQFSSFKRACEHFGWKIVENSKIRTYRNDPSRNTVYPMIALNPNHGYDLGIQFNEKTGELEVLGDFFDGSVAQTLGRDLDKLKQEYAACVAEDYFTIMGWSATREITEDGKIVVNGESM